MVILELGVGLNTPGVLKWSNEDLVENNNTPEEEGRFRLIHAGIGAAGSTLWELEERDLAVGIAGDLSGIVPALVE